MLAPSLGQIVPKTHIHLPSLSSFLQPPHLTSFTSSSTTIPNSNFLNYCKSPRISINLKMKMQFSTSAIMAATLGALAFAAPLENAVGLPYL